MNTMIFYHGTSDALDVKKLLLPPYKTGNLREQWRNKYMDKVFFTDSKLSAKMYAKKACVKYGGNPIIYVVRPIGQCFHRVNTEYVADKALIISKIE